MASKPPSPSSPTAASAISSSLPAPKKREPEHGVRARAASAARGPTRARGRRRAATPPPRPAPPARGTTGGCGRSPAQAPRTPPATINPSTGREGAIAAVSSRMLGSHIAASSTARPGNRAVAGAPRPPVPPAARADQAQPDHRPAPRAEVGEPVAQLRQVRRGASPRASIALPDMSSGMSIPRRSSTVGAMSVELTRPSVRVESGVERRAVPRARRRPSPRAAG